MIDAGFGKLVVGEDDMAVFTLGCIICSEKFRLDQIGVSFFISTGVCLVCYRVGKLMSAEEWCFGKKEIYEPESQECRLLCPDRKICRLVVQGKLSL